MPEQIYIGGKEFGGLQTNVEPFNLDNGTFPFLFNFCPWRGRILKKRGTSTVGRLTNTIYLAASPNQWQTLSFNLSGDTGNLLNNASYTLETTSSVTPGLISIIIAGNTYKDTNKDGNLIGTPAGTGTINYATGSIKITGGGASQVTGSFSYFTGLPVMGLRDFTDITNPLYPVTLAFDTKYSYQVDDSSGTAVFFPTTYYKTTAIPFTWTGQDWQQFWTVNYQSALWATNGKPGFHFVKGTFTSGSGTTILTFNFKSGGVNFTKLIIGDQLFFNEWFGVGPPISTLNNLVGSVSDISDAVNGNYKVTFTNTVNVAPADIGIAQLLTNSIPGQDGIRWYDGPPKTSVGTPTGTLGWVNFAPPLTGSASVSINDKMAKLYYLTGAAAILPYKDRLLFFSPYITASDGTQIQLVDTVLWSWNGTPYYASLPLPTNETANANAYYVDQTGLGGYLAAGISQPIQMVNINEDVLIIGFGGNGRKTRFAYTGNDIQPFLFYSINSELPSNALFSAITLDRGVLDIGPYGITITDQQSSRRIDLNIPDFVFQIQQVNNGSTSHGPQRICSVRNFQKEWIYFCYPPENSPYTYPTQSFYYNYREDMWAIMYENFTSFGSYRATQDITWATLPYLNWNEWVDPWNYGDVGGLYRSIIGGTPQGFVLKKDQGISEGQSCFISAIQDNGSGRTQITSPNHCLLAENPNTGSGDFIYFQNCLGLTYLNGVVAEVDSVIDNNNFVIDVAFQAGTYTGLGTFAKLCHPYLQTKMFNPYWEQGRKVRLCAQKYLFDKTWEGQVNIDIFLSQDPENAWNNTNEVGFDENIYSILVYTCPETYNSGLTPTLTAPNTNLQMPLSLGSSQIWHRDNTSLIGDSVQIGITLSPTQMEDFNLATSEIVLHGIQLTVDRSQLLS